jgi:hypothetical protein
MGAKTCSMLSNFPFPGLGTYSLLVSFLSLVTVKSDIRTLLFLYFSFLPFYLA